MIDLKLLAQYEADSPAAFGKVGYRFRKQFNEGWYDGIVVKVLKRGGKICVRQLSLSHNTPSSHIASTTLSCPYEANGKDRRVHYSADDDFEDLSLDDLQMLASLDHLSCDECRSRKMYCDGTQPFCVNNETMNHEVDQEAEEQSDSEEEDDESRSSRGSRGGHRKVSSKKASPADKEDGPTDSFQPTANDMVISLKDEQYREVLFKAYRKLGAKKEQERDKDLERQVKLDVFNSFKNSGTRFVKHINYRKPDLGLIEADDVYARESKFIKYIFWGRLLSPPNVLSYCFPSLL